MDVVDTALPGVKLIKPQLFRDDRGGFLETWQHNRYGASGIPTTFVQDNAAFSRKGVLRGLHYQWPEPQGKLVMVLYGEVFDVAVDIRRGSPTFGSWMGEWLSHENGHQLWIPEGFAHGYLVLSGVAVFAYKCTRPYVQAADRTIGWNDPAIGVEWPETEGGPFLSEKDAAAPLLGDVAPDALPILLSTEGSAAEATT